MARLRLPQLPSFEATAFACALALLAAALAARAPRLTELRPPEVARVAIEGDFVHLGRARIEELVARAAADGYFFVDLAALERRLKDEVWVRDAEVARAWPGGLRVAIREHKPAAYLDGGGFVSKRGAVFAPPDAAGHDLPTLFVPLGREAQALALHRRFEAALLPARVAELVEDAHGSVRARLDDGVEVILGRDRRAFDARLRRFARLRASLAANAAPGAAQAGGPAYFDTRYPDGVAAGGE